jgi:hypothetical protein
MNELFKLGKLTTNSAISLCSRLNVEQDPDSTYLVLFSKERV